MADHPHGASTIDDLKSADSKHAQVGQKNGQEAGASGSDWATPTAGASLPPSRQRDAEDVLAEMKRVPLFMNSIDDMDDDNPQLEALKALAYEDAPADNAENFKTQGNEAVREKRWTDAREYYTKALQALKMPRRLEDGSSAPSASHAEEIDNAAEERRERHIEEACYANRALCNLEMKNYGSCNRDCAAALRLNPRNVKAWFRAASACLALDKIPEALDACESGLRYDGSNPAFKTLLSKIEKRRDHLAELEQVRSLREEQSAKQKLTLRHALRQHGLITRESASSPDMEDAVIALADPTDPKSLLSIPVVFLYPLHAQSDFVKAFREDETLSHHLEYILPLPWDAEKEYTLQCIDCYMETISGGLIKAGKNVSLMKLISSGKVEIVDGLIKMNIVPKAKASTWIEDFKRRKGTT